MAIRFVDVEEFGKDREAEPAPARRARTPEAAPEPTPGTVEAAPTAGVGAASGDEVPLPGLPHAKPEPKARGRRKPLSAAPSETPKPAAGPAAPLLDGLLPELQAHAKPTPKPRGRKKAFG